MRPSSNPGSRPYSRPRRRTGPTRKHAALARLAPNAARQGCRAWPCCRSASCTRTLASWLACSASAAPAVRWPSHPPTCLQGARCPAAWRPSTPQACARVERRPPNARPRPNAGPRHERERVAAVWPHSVRYGREVRRSRAPPALASAALPRWGHEADRHARRWARRSGRSC